MSSNRPDAKQIAKARRHAKRIWKALQEVFFWEASTIDSKSEIIICALFENFSSPKSNRVSVWYRVNVKGKYHSENPLLIRKVVYNNLLVEELMKIAKSNGVRYYTKQAVGYQNQIIFSFWK